MAPRASQASSAVSSTLTGRTAETCGEGSDAAAGPAAGRDQSMEGKYCIVTGSNSGIGFQVARGLMQRGAHVVMACRNMATCQQAAAVLRTEGLSGSCTCRRIDLEDFGSIRDFAKQQIVELSEAAEAGRVGSRGLCSVGRRLDVLVNNAGVMGVGVAHDGSDRHLTANHLGPYLLTRLLLPHMSHGSRIINVASRAHYMGSLSLTPGLTGSETISQDTHHWWWQYARSKLCNVLCTAELQRRYGYGSPYAVGLQDATAHGDAGGAGGAGAGATIRGIGAYAVSPGLVDTGIFRYLLPGWAKWLRVPLWPLFRTPQQGAEVVLYAASSPDLEGRNVLFLHDCRQVNPSVVARDPRLAANLWRVSAALVGLPEEEGALQA